MEEQAESISKLMKKALKNDKITVKVEKLKNKKISSMITLSEESRRMQDMMKMYSMPGMDMSADVYKRQLTMTPRSSRMIRSLSWIRPVSES